MARLFGRSRRMLLRGVVTDEEPRVRYFAEMPDPRLNYWPLARPPNLDLLGPTARSPSPQGHACSTAQMFRVPACEVLLAGLAQPRRSRRLAGSAELPLADAHSARRHCSSFRLLSLWRTHYAVRSPQLMLSSSMCQPSDELASSPSAKSAADPARCLYFQLRTDGSPAGPFALTHDSPVGNSLRLLVSPFLPDSPRVKSEAVHPHLFTRL